MRIISKFHDYYDIGLGLGYAANLDYIRTEREVILSPDCKKDESLEDKTTRELAKILPRRANMPTNLAVKTITIGFCGKFYPVVIFPGEFYGKSIYCYSIEDVDKQINLTASKGEIERWFAGYNYGSRNAMRNMFTQYSDFENIETFLINRSPIVLFEGVIMSIKDKPRAVYIARWNPRLRDYGFYRVVDPYIAFQSIEMFLGNLANPEKPVPPRTDKEKIESHGMDPKLSFRKKKKGNEKS